MERFHTRITLPAALVLSIYILAVAAIWLGSTQVLLLWAVPPAVILIFALIDVVRSRGDRLLPLTVGASFLLLSIMSIAVLAVGFGGI
jgi:hypothetical protein